MLISTALLFCVNYCFTLTYGELYKGSVNRHGGLNVRMSVACQLTLNLAAVLLTVDDTIGRVLFDWPDPVGPDLAVLFRWPEAKQPARTGPTGSGHSKRTQPLYVIMLSCLHLCDCVVVTVRCH